MIKNPLQCNEQLDSKYFQRDITIYCNILWYFLLINLKIQLYWISNLWMKPNIAFPTCIDKEVLTTLSITIFLVAWSCLSLDSWLPTRGQHRDLYKGTHKSAGCFIYLVLCSSTLLQGTKINDSLGPPPGGWPPGYAPGNYSK